MPSTKLRTTSEPEYDWASTGLRYYSLNFFYQSKFGRKVRKISLDAGLGCPHRDNSSEHTGCIFCDPASFSPSRRYQSGDIREQIDRAAAKLTHLYGVDRFIAYFQPGTNTHAPVDVLRSLFAPAFDHPAVVGVAIGTRPDCLADEAIDLLSALSDKKTLFLEMGLQSIQDRSLRWMNRGHDFAAFDDAVDRCHARGVEVGTHIIFGFPDESTDDAIATARYISRKKIRAVKIHNLLAVKNTRLGDLVAKGEVALPSLEEYVKTVIAFLENLSPAVVVERLFSSAPSEYLLGPDWGRDRNAVQRAFDDAFERRGLRQGSQFTS